VQATLTASKLGSFAFPQPRPEYHRVKKFVLLKFGASGLQFSGMILIYNFLPLTAEKLRDV
jgi:hypothetical protein